MSEILAAMVSELADVAAAEVGPGFPLGHTKLASSLGRAKLDARLRRRLSVRLDNLGSLRTLAELEEAVLAPELGGARLRHVLGPAVDLSPVGGGPSAHPPADALQCFAERSRCDAFRHADRLLERHPGIDERGEAL